MSRLCPSYGAAIPGQRCSKGTSKVGGKVLYAYPQFKLASLATEPSPSSPGHKHSLFGRKKHLPSSLCLMLLTGQQDVGHEDVATGRGAISLRSFPFRFSSSNSLFMV